MSASALLRCRGLEAGYGASQVLFGLDFDIRAGEVVALLGRNGMGKSTTIRTIVGGLRPQRGEIRFDGRDIHGARADVRHTRVVVENFGLTEFGEKRAPMAVGIDQGAHITILGRKGRALARQQTRITHRPERRFIAVTGQVLTEYKRHHGFKHRHFYRLAKAGFLAPIQSRRNLPDRSSADGAVDHRYRHITWHTVADGGDQRRNADRALNQVVVGRFGGIGPALPVTKHANVNDARIDRRDVGVGQI